MTAWLEPLVHATPAELLALTNWIILIGILIGVLEQAASHRQYKDNDVYDWHVLKHSYRLFLLPRYEGFFEALFGYRAYLVNLAMQFAMAAASAAALWRGEPTTSMTAALLFLILLFAGLAPESRLVQSASLGFIGLQSILSYVTAGVYKAVAPSWRSGSSLTLVMSTKSYGRPDLSGLLVRNPPISRTLSVILIAFECLFFLVLFIGPYGCLGFLIAGFVFHFLNAAIMGLNNFLWAFTASYPGVLFCTLTVSEWLYG